MSAASSKSLLGFAHLILSFGLDFIHLFGLPLPCPLLALRHRPRGNKKHARPVIPCGERRARSAATLMNQATATPY